MNICIFLVAILTSLQEILLLYDSLVLILNNSFLLYLFPCFMLSISMFSQTLLNFFRNCIICKLQNFFWNHFFAFFSLRSVFISMDSSNQASCLNLITTAQKMNKSLTENFSFCAVNSIHFLILIHDLMLLLNFLCV